jgi:hypothetical protein
MPADQCAREAIDSFKRRKYMHAPGIFMRAGTSLMAFIPRQFLASRVAAVYKSALVKARAQAG